MEAIRDLINFPKAFWRVWTNQEIGFSFNVADRCPIGCQCYWRAQERAREMADGDVVAFFNEMRRRGYLIAVLIGGEPYVRPRLLEHLAPIMPATWIITSGTTPLIRLPRTTHFISVDGESERTHDTVRRSPGLFRRIVRNLEHAKSTNDFPLYIHSVLNAVNYLEIEGILRFWKKSALADGVIFSTMTPINGGGLIDYKLRLSDVQLEWIVNELIKQKGEFGNFLMNTKEMINLYRPMTMQFQNPQICETARYVPSFDAAGQRIAQCVLSDKADCSRCGCVVSAMFKTAMRFPPSVSAVKVLSRLRTRT